MNDNHIADEREPIHQTSTHGHVWHDVTPLDYEMSNANQKRIVYAAPIAPRADADTAGAKPLTDAEIEAGWRHTFSTDNPYCPCNLKSFTKAVRWAERAKEKK